MLLPLVGGTLGAVEGYRRGGLGGAILGAGAGAVTPAALRMAGTALGANLIGAGALKAGAKGVASKAMGLGQTAAGLAGGGKAAQLGAQVLDKGVVPGLNALSRGIMNPAALGGLTAGAGTLLGAPSLTGGIAGGLTGAAGRVGQAGVGVIGRTSTGEPVYGQIGGGAVPPVGQYGGIDPYGDPLDVYGVPGMGQRAQTFKDAENLRDVMRLLNPEILAASEARSKKEFERMMAAAGIRQNIATRAAMQQNAQEAGLRAGMTAAQQAGDALTRQYQYQ
jgi:hypothetical protein